MKNNLLDELMTLIEDVNVSGVEGHAGQHGQGIDALFAGPFHPDFGELGKLLQGQLDRKKSLSKWNRENTGIYDILYKLVPEFEEKIKNAVTDYGDAYKDTEIVYDKIVKMTDEDIDNFKNDTNEFKPVWRE